MKELEIARKAHLHLWTLHDRCCFGKTLTPEWVMTSQWKNRIVILPHLSKAIATLDRSHEKWSASGRRHRDAIDGCISETKTHLGLPWPWKPAWTAGGLVERLHRDGWLCRFGVLRLPVAMLEASRRRDIDVEVACASRTKMQEMMPNQALSACIQLWPPRLRCLPGNSTSG